MPARSSQKENRITQLGIRGNAKNAWLEVRQPESTYLHKLRGYQLAATIALLDFVDCNHLGEDCVACGRFRAEAVAWIQVHVPREA